MLVDYELLLISVNSHSASSLLPSSMQLVSCEIVLEIWLNIVNVLCAMKAVLMMPGLKPSQALFATENGKKLAGEIICQCWQNLKRVGFLELQCLEWVLNQSQQ